jgi:hypothetical protein
MALAGSAAVVAGVLTAVSAGPAAAQSPYMVLQNDQSYGTFAFSGVNPGSAIDVKTEPFGTWEFELSAQEQTLGDVTGGGVQFFAVSTSGKGPDLCLADTGPDDQAYLANCNADGTVFIAQENGDGTFFYSRYLYDQGYGYWVLAVYSPSEDAPLITYPAASIGGSYYGRWEDDY